MYVYYIYTVYITYGKLFVIYGRLFVIFGTLLESGEIVNGQFSLI